MKKRDVWIQSRVDGVRSLEKNRPSFDAIGITWDRQELETLIHRGFDPTQNYHRGFKGYRLDVQITRPGAAGGEWYTLCNLSRNALSPIYRRALHCNDGENWKESGRREGYLPLPVEADSSAAAGAPNPALALPRDFIVWAGSSAVKPHPLDQLAILQDKSAAAPKGREDINRAPLLEDHATGAEDELQPELSKVI